MPPVAPGLIAVGYIPLIAGVLSKVYEIESGHYK